MSGVQDRIGHFGMVVCLVGGLSGSDAMRSGQMVLLSWEWFVKG